MRIKKIYFLERKEYAEIKIYLINHCMTAKKLAEQLGVDYSYLNAVIEGRATFSQEMREKFEKELGLYFEK